MGTSLLMASGLSSRTALRGVAVRAAPASATRSRSAAQLEVVRARGTIFGGLRRDGKEKRKDIREKLLQEIEGTGRGVKAGTEKKEAIDSLCSSLEKINPTKKPLASDLINGRWKLVYTTSDSILGTKRPAFLRPSGPIYQTIDANALKAKNQETFPFFNSVKADLTPVNSSLVNVQFKQFTIGGIISVDAPESAKGKLDTTYLDEEMRLGRGDKGNLFVLLMEDPSETLGE